MTRCTRFKQVLADACDYRVDEQVELIEQTLGQHERDEGAAGADGDVLAGLLLESRANA